MSRPKRLLYAAVTGASSGIGRELVRQLTNNRGMTVLATARRADLLETLVADCATGRVIPMAGDLTAPRFRSQFWERATAFPGGLDLLVNNAGRGAYSLFEDQDSAIIESIFSLNVTALFDLTQRGIAHMRGRGGGQILQISSVLGFVGMPYSAAYVASKHAVNGLVKSLQGELVGTGVRVWAACPGRTASEFSKVAAGPGGASYKMPRGAPVEKIVRLIVKELDGRRTFLMPGLTARACVELGRWTPGLFDKIVCRWARKNRVPGMAESHSQHSQSDR